MSTEFVTHNRINLALHTLEPDIPPSEVPDTLIEGARRDRLPLLLLHGLGERSPDSVPTYARTWPGPVCALDFTGHGESTLPRGGGYTAEILLADADVALRAVGEATVVGRGVGAYIALLLAGARAQQVHGAVLADGPGISGGPSVPTSQPVFTLASVDGTPDPYAIVELGRDLRPPDYATTFARLALQGSPLERPITVVAQFRPAWLDAVAAEPGVAEASSIEAALADYAQLD